MEQENKKSFNINLDIENFNKTLEEKLAKLWLTEEERIATEIFIMNFF